MNREILFRAKCIDETCLNGEWLDGDILHDGITGRYYVNKNSCLNESDIIGEEGLLRFVAYEVDPETVCQYTGLTDKNGRKVFEGDIIECKGNGRHFLSQIEWDCVCGGFMLQDTKEGSAVGLDALSSGGIYSDFILVGNIFDNQELIGK